jgi:hypothetical protein
MRRSREILNLASAGVHKNENIDREGRYAGNVPQFGKNPRSGLLYVALLFLRRSHLQCRQILRKNLYHSCQRFAPRSLLLW